MTKARQLVSEALELGGEPDFIDPEKRRRIEGGEHPYAGNQAVPPELAELLASEAYTELIRKVQRYTGVRPRGRQDMFQLMHMMQDAAHQVMRIEHGHERALERAAVEIVLGLPEYKSAKQAVEAGDLRIIAQLTPQGADLRGAQVDPAEDPEAAQAELQIAQVAQELDLEIQKRRFTNMMIQGSAMHKNYAFHLADEALTAINPRLLNLYGTLMSLGELMYWAVPEEMQAGMMGHGAAGPERAHGSVRIEQGEGGVPVIRAQAIVFPVLVQELAKGLMEYLSHSDEDDPETRKHVLGKTDTLRNEVWDTMLGPAVWKRVLAVIGPENQDLMPHIYDHLQKLSPNEFNRIMQGVLRNDPQSKEYIQRIAQEARGEAEGGPDEPAAPGDGGGGNEEDNADWWKKESSAKSIVNDLLE